MLGVRRLLLGNLTCGGDEVSGRTAGGTFTHLGAKKKSSPSIFHLEATESYAKLTLTWFKSIWVGKLNKQKTAAVSGCLASGSGGCFQTYRLVSR